MGWWSTAVMGGDGPADVAYDIMGIIEEQLPPEMRARFADDDGDGEEVDAELTEDDFCQMRDAFANVLPQLIEMIEKEEGYEAYIGYQVLGVSMMMHGAYIPDDLRAKIIDCAKEDEWAQDDEERKGFMDSFIADLEKYDNKTPTLLSEADEGLFNTLLDVLEQGLINKKGP